MQHWILTDSTVCRRIAEGFAYEVIKAKNKRKSNREGHQYIGIFKDISVNGKLALGSSFTIIFEIAETS